MSKMLDMFMKIVLKIVLWFVIPVAIVSSIAQSMGFASIKEMCKGTVEEVFPFGNIIAGVIDAFEKIDVGKPITFDMIMCDIIKSLIISMSFSLAIKFVSAVTGINSKKKVAFFFVRAITAAVLALVAGWLIELIMAELREEIGKFGTVTMMFVLFFTVFIIWSTVIRSISGTFFSFTAVASTLFFRSLAPSLLTTQGIYIALSILFICFVDGDLGYALVVPAITLFGIVLAISSLFEGSKIKI